MTDSYVSSRMGKAQPQPQIPKTDAKNANSSVFSYEDRVKCIERVCNDLQSNIEEFCEIQNSLQELELILKDQDNDQYMENKDIQERLQQALRVNLNQKEILKEILLKIGDHQMPYIADLELQIRQQQLEMYNLIQTNQELQSTVQKLEAELQQRNLSESSSSHRVIQPQASNDMSKQVCENPFEHRLNTQSEELFVRSELKNYSNQKTGETPSKKVDKENLQTFQSAQGSSEAYYSVENIPDRVQERRQPFVAHIQLASPSYKTCSSSGLTENDTQNKRYSSSNNGFTRTNLTSLNIIQNLQPRQLYSSPSHSKKMKNSSGTNPLASSQESFFQGESSVKKHEGSPQIYSTSRTLVTKCPKGKPSQSNMLIVD